MASHDLRNTKRESEGAMEGRWQVRIEDGFGNYTKGPKTIGWVPVVPCDDEAVERATRAIRENSHPHGHYVGASELAQIALRAAGETP